MNKSSWSTLSCPLRVLSEYRLQCMLVNGVFAMLTVILGVIGLSVHSITSHQEIEDKGIYDKANYKAVPTCQSVYV